MLLLQDFWLEVKFYKKRGEIDFASFIIYFR